MTCRQHREGWLRTGMLAAALALSAGSAGPAAWAQGAAAPAELAPITPEDIMGLTDVTDVEISPDGRHLLYVTQPTIATHRPTRSAIWVVPTDGSAPPRRLTAGTALEGSPQWSPDGSGIAFLTDHPGSSRQLWLIPASGREAQRLTDIGSDIRLYRWSPDGRSIALLAPDPPSAEAKAARAAKRDAVEVDAAEATTLLWLLDPASRAVRRIAIAGRDVTDLSWSPDGKRLAVRAAATGGPNDLFYHSDLLLIDAATGTVERTVFKRVYSTGSWSPDGSRLAFTAPEEGLIGIRAFVAEVASGAVQQFGASLDGTIREVEWGGDDRTLRARTAVNTRDVLFSVDLPAGRFKPLIRFDGRIKDFSAAADGSIALVGSQADRPADIWVQRRGSLRLVTDINPQIRGRALGKVEEVRWTSSADGQPIYGVLVTPPAHRAGKPAKTVVLTHGGPHENWNIGWQGSWIDWAQLLASHGYVVLLPNPRGSSGQGSAFARGNTRGWGTRDYQDVVDGVDMLVARRISDPARIGIGGWSYGGFMSAWAVTHDTRFKTAVIGAALTDQFNAAMAMDTPDFVTSYFGLPPTAIAQMDASSPMRAVDRVTVPVLVLHGQEDRRVPIGQGLGFYRGLRLLGKDATMIAYPREPHRIFEFEHQLDMQRRILAWYDAHL
ncbi:dipeptidyl aminopeptidase/acylaminoacyl peptidase [Sphingomonas zeicaulis]|uniref:S9 family peptidase n=1 Tax=Sphingomonas zeicaulis TaxID=1632740 RepID=UPI003D1967EB